VKCEVTEYPGFFGVELTPETIEEAAVLIRLGMNATRELRYVGAAARSDKTIDASITIGKAKRGASAIARGKY